MRVISVIRHVKIAVAVHVLLIIVVDIIVVADVTCGQFLQAFAVWKSNFGVAEAGQLVLVAVVELHLLDQPLVHLLLKQFVLEKFIVSVLLAQRVVLVLAQMDIITM